MNSKQKKKRGQSKKQQSSPKKSQPKQKVEPESEGSVDSDSGSGSNDDDADFAKRMASVQGASGTAQKSKSKSQPVSRSASASGVTEGAANSGPQASGTAAKGPPGGSMGLDSFTIAGKPANKEPKKVKPSISWPLEHFEFRLVCRLCFIKEKEGIGGCTYRQGYSHSCSHDILIVRSKNNNSFNWLKIRPRNIVEGVSDTFQFKLCKNFQSGQPCRVGESNCSFAHSPAEITFWNLDRDGDFSVGKFITRAKLSGIYASEDPAVKAASAAPPQAPTERYIPGLTAKPSTTNNAATTPYATANNWAPPVSQSASNVRQWSPPSQPQQQSRSPLAQPEQLDNDELETRAPSGPQQTTFTVPYPQTFNQSEKVPPKLSTPPPQQVQQQPQNNTFHLPFNTPYGQTAPIVENPIPELMCKVLCPACMEFTHTPWYYYYRDSLHHDCEHSILAYRVDPQNGLWVQVRERASHRFFQGNYVMCRSVMFSRVDACPFKASCSFAHNEVEQQLWKMEQQGQYDIGEFVLQARLRANAIKGSPMSSIGSSRSSSGMYVKELLDKFGGYFRFICRDCFFARVPMISGMDSSGLTCLGQGHHPWRSSRIVAHVMDTAFTPVDERKLVHREAFYLMCNYQQYCQKWFGNQCKYAHSQVEKAVWMLERDTKITREELVQQSASLFTAKQTMSAPPVRSGGGAQQSFWAHAPQAQTQQPQQTTQVQGQAQTKTSAPVSTPSVLIKEFCRTCWGKGQKSDEDKGKDRCVCGHSNFKLNSAFVTVPAGKEIRSLPALPTGMKLILCEYFPKCTLRVCTHPHGQEELEVWGWMLRNNIKTLREVCDRCTEAQKQRVRNAGHGESSSGGSTAVFPTTATPAPSIVGASAAAKSKPVNQIIAPGDLHIHEHYCQYCGISCNSERQWDEHRMSERHISNVNSDKEHQWNYRQPPWGQGKNLDLCAKHLLNKSCQYSYVPDMYNLCRYAHSQEELDEWRERHEWRQMKRMHARDRNMSSYTEALLEEYHNHTMGSSVMAENIPDVRVICEEDQVLYRKEKNDIFTWTFQIHSKKTLDKVALLYNKDRLHFKLLSNTGG